MRKYVIVPMAVSVILGLLPLGRAEAGPFIKQYQVLCKVTTGGPLTVPFLTNPGPTPWSIACGKDKNQAHPVLGVDETFCQMASASANGKKALKTKPLPPGPAGMLKGSNCNITGGGLVLPVLFGLGPNCGLSQGTGTITISHNTDKAVVVNINWPPTAGDVLPIIADAPAKPAVGSGVIGTASDFYKKGESCFAAPGADQFKVAGTLYLIGNK